MLLKAVATILTFSAVAFAQENLLTNPSFEDKAGEKPKGWHAQAYDARHITDGVAGDTTHTGTSALQLNDPKDFHQRWAVNNPMMIEVAGGETVIYSAWVKVSGMDGKQFVQLRIEQHDTDGKILPKGEGSQYVLGAKHRPAEGKWAQIRDEIKLGPDARKIRPLLVFASANPDSSASATFDDVELSKKQ
jgi:hypothetical protein